VEEFMPNGGHRQKITFSEAIMSGKTGKRITGKKPDTVRRQSAKTDGASGKETDAQVTSGDSNRNVDKSVRRRIDSK
jgi:hypothetical protein